MVLLDVDFSCGVEDEEDVGELAGVGELFCGTETETPWRGMKEFIGICGTTAEIPG